MHSDVSVEKKHEGVRGIITGIKESRGWLSYCPPLFSEFIDSSN